MKYFVVDTNVGVVANGAAPQADEECRDVCIGALERVRRNRILLDEELRILGEYLQRLNLAGQPGPGDAFLKWVFEVQADTRHCERIEITPREGAEDDFEEFPQDESLKGFDPADRKFVAVALASGRHPLVLNAVDSDWGHYHSSLKRHGVQVEFLCPQHVSENSKPPRKRRRK